MKKVSKNTKVEIIPEEEIVEVKIPKFHQGKLILSSEQKMINGILCEYLVLEDSTTTHYPI